MHPPSLARGSFLLRLKSALKESPSYIQTRNKRRGNEPKKSNFLFIFWCFGYRFGVVFNRPSLHRPKAALLFSQSRLHHPGSAFALPLFQKLLVPPLAPPRPHQSGHFLTQDSLIPFFLKFRSTCPIEKILRKAKKPGFLVLQEFFAAKNRWLSRWVKEHLVFSMDKYDRNTEK